MPTLETDAAVISLPAADAIPSLSGENGGAYDDVRLCAMKHAILNRYTVLFHEDADEYRALFSALMEDYQPVGATEAHLVENWPASSGARGACFRPRTRTSNRD